MPIALLLLHRRQQIGGTRYQFAPQWPALQFFQGHPAAMAEVAFEHRLDLLGKTRVGNEGGDFEVEPKRAIVEVDRPYRGAVIINQHYFLVQETRLITVYFDAGANHI